MGNDVLPDSGSDFGQRVRRRLREEQVVWFTTVGADGTPQPNPVWFLWDEGATALVYNRADANRLTHIASRERVALQFDGDGHGGDIVVMLGRAQLVEDVPAPHANAAYVAKYGDAMTMVSGSPEAFSAAYPVAIAVQIERIRGH
ncbi:MAG: TIGR03667 family PPOX class F420-dependent oxidoreductase [Pseudonocardiales bacterium]|nr:MAG: TIGR03667 family PPOX class F420-dependent oxidoreductase [Pseudonocardiales bacterium]